MYVTVQLYFLKDLPSHTVLYFEIIYNKEMRKRFKGSSIQGFKDKDIQRFKDKKIKD